MYFQIQMDHFIPMLVKNISNRCSAKTYYINCLTHKNRKSITTSCSTGQPTNKLRFCSHMLVVFIALLAIHDSTATPQFRTAWIITRFCLLVCEQYGSYTARQDAI